MRKKILTILAMAIMIVSMIPSMAFADTAVDMTASEFLALRTDGEIVLENDVKLTEAVTIDADTKLNLNGHTLTLAETSNYAIVVKDDLFITGNGTIEIPGEYGIGVSTSCVGVLVIENGTFNAGPNNVYMIGSWGPVAILGGTFNGTYCVLNCFNYNDTAIGEAMIEDGIFSVSEDDGYVVAAGKGAVIGIEDGTFNGPLYTDDGAVIEIIGGTFDTDVSEYVNDNYMQNNAGKVVPKNNNDNNDNNNNDSNAGNNDSNNNNNNNNNSNNTNNDNNNKDTDKTADKDDSPETGDMGISILPIILMVIAMAGIGVLFCTRKKE